MASRDIPHCPFFVVIDPTPRLRWLAVNTRSSGAGAGQTRRCSCSVWDGCVMCGVSAWCVPRGDNTSLHLKVYTLVVHVSPPSICFPRMHRVSDVTTLKVSLAAYNGEGHTFIIIPFYFWSLYWLCCSKN